MRFIFGLLALVATQLNAQAASDVTAIYNIVQNEARAWGKGDAAGYSRDFSATGTFTNIRGEYFTGYAAFLKQHEVIFQGIFNHTTAQLDIEALQFVNGDVAIVEVLTAVAGIVAPKPGMTLDAKGRLRTRLLQVVARQNGEWKVVAYHNVDLKPGVPVPDPK